MIPVGRGPFHTMESNLRRSHLPTMVAESTLASTPPGLCIQPHHRGRSAATSVGDSHTGEGRRISGRGTGRRACRNFPLLRDTDPLATPHPAARPRSDIVCPSDDSTGIRRWSSSSRCWATATVFRANLLRWQSPLRKIVGATYAPDKGPFRFGADRSVLDIDIRPTRQQTRYDALRRNAPGDALRLRASITSLRCNSNCKSRSPKMGTGSVEILILPRLCALPTVPVPIFHSPLTA